MAGFQTVRRRVSLIEVLVVVGILAILIGLVLGAIQKVRESAVAIQNKNNLRQIILAVHQVADERESTIPKLMRSNMTGINVIEGDAAIFRRILPYVHPNLPKIYNGGTDAELNELAFPVVKMYRNPADPSWDHDRGLRGMPCKCSYAANMFAMDGSISLISSIPDGSSQTIAFGDKYYARCSSATDMAQTMNDFGYVFDPHNGEISDVRRATFADKGWHDVLPVTDAATRTTRPSVPGKTFQVRPRPEEVEPSILQATFRGGLTVALFDGSVRTIAPSIHESAFWGLVTPAGGEVVSLD